VELFTDLGCVGHGGDGLGPQVLGVGAGEANAPDAVDGADPPEEVGEEGAAVGDVTSVRVDVLAEQGDLGDAAPSQFSTSPTMSLTGRLTSGPRTDGTMQNAHELSHPI
jgi:hypothetical protein